MPMHFPFPSLAPAQNGLNSGNPQQARAEVLKLFQIGGDASDVLAGGSLLPEQQEAFFWYVRAYGVMLAQHLGSYNDFPENSPIRNVMQGPLNLSTGAAGAQIGGFTIAGTPLVPGNCRLKVHRDGRTSGIYDQAYITEPITRGATENTQDADQYGQNPAKLGRRTFATQKLRSSYGFTLDFLVQNLMRGQLNEELGKALGPRLGTDYEWLAVQGDVDLPDDGTPLNRLLRQNDGWVKISRQQCPRFSLGGEFIEHAAFLQAQRRVPDGQLTLGFKWWMHPRVWIDWLEYLSNRAGGAIEASAALGGQGIAPVGFPVVRVPALPRNLPITMFAGATEARVLGGRIGPFSFLRDAFQISLNVDGAGAETIVFPTVEDADVQNRALNTPRTAAIINQQYSAAQGNAYQNVAREGPDGRLELISPTTGAGSSIALVAPANSALGLLGLVAGVTTGEAADVGVGNNTRNVGSLVWFSPDWNFVWHVNTSYPGSDTIGVRTFQKFDQSSDRMLFDIYSHQDATIELPELTIVMEDVRVADVDQEALNP